MSPALPRRFRSEADARRFTPLPDHLAPENVASESLASEQSSQTSRRTTAYGLRQEALSPIETLAQSVSTIAPTCTPVATVPLVFALAGNATWLAYVVALIGVLLVARCIGWLARYSASPGSLYTYASMILPPWLGAVAAWSLLLAYIATGASVAAGFYHYANIVLVGATGRSVSTVLLSLLVGGVSMWIACRDVKISARLMLCIEAASILVILSVVTLFLAAHGTHPDRAQLGLHGVTGSGFRLGLVLALFSFVGFESATTLGAEAHDPLRTIPRAVIQSAIIAGVFFTICAYTEVLGLHAAGQDLANSQAPMRVLAALAGVPAFGTLIDVGVIVSMFAGTLACITAAARVLLLMSHNRMVHASLRETHVRRETPVRAILVTGAATVIPVMVLAAMGDSGLDVYGWMGSLATYGFIVTYGLVCLALPRYLRDHGASQSGARTVAALAVVAMLLALVGNLYPVPEGPYGKLPYIYLVYLMVGMIWFFSTRSRDVSSPSSAD